MDPGGYQFIDGTYSEFTNFVSGEPKVSSTDTSSFGTCAYFIASLGRIEGRPCDDNVTYICDRYKGKIIFY